jgi:hypothetical protein
VLAVLLSAGFAIVGVGRPLSAGIALHGIDIGPAIVSGTSLLQKIHIKNHAKAIRIECLFAHSPAAGDLH